MLYTPPPPPPTPAPIVERDRREQAPATAPAPAQAPQAQPLPPSVPVGGRRVAASDRRGPHGYDPTNGWRFKRSQRERRRDGRR